MKIKSLLGIFLSFFCIGILIQSCQEKGAKRECVLDHISHLEDSICYHIDSLPRLCDVLGVKGRLVDIGDCRLYCEVQGSGIPMVVINGGPGGTHHYFHPWFAKAENYCKVIYYDQRGCGLSDFEKGTGYSFKQAIDDLDRLRQKLGIEKWIICGYSYGGALAQYYSTQYPEYVLGMVLVGSATLFQDPAFDGTREYDYISKEEQQQIDELYEMWRKGSLSMTQLLYNKDLNGDWKRQNFYKPTKAEFIRSALYEWVNDSGFNYTVGSDYHRYDFKGVFDSNPIPTLICEGKWDLTWGPEKAEIFRQNHPNAKFALFENAGHTIFSEDSKLFFSTLKRFVKTLKAVSERDVELWKQRAGDILLPQIELFSREDYFFNIIKKDGVDKAYEYYRIRRQAGEKLFTESGMNELGYDYLSNEDYGTAIRIFEMNADSYPDSSNVYDSLGEAYLESGNTEKAKEYYTKALEITPDLVSAKEALEKLNMI